MKKILYILLFCGSFTSCNSQNEKTSDFIKTLGNGYYSISNQIGNQFILKDYLNYKNSNDSIFFEKILYLYQKDNFSLIIGNLMGSKTSIVLELEKRDKPVITYVEEIGLIRAVKKYVCKNYTFFELSSSYSDICVDREISTIYVLDNLILYKSFEGIKKEEYSDIDDSLCLKGVSYIQNFDLKFNNNEVILNVTKKAKKKIEFKKYYFKNRQFKQ